MTTTVDQGAVFDKVADRISTLNDIAAIYRQLAGNLRTAVTLVENIPDLETLTAARPVLLERLTEAAEGFDDAADLVANPPHRNPAVWKALLDLTAEEMRHG